MSTSGSNSSFDEFLASLAHLPATTVAMMVTSVDGRATIGGRVGNLTGKADQRVLMTLREHAAAVVIGSGTKTAEGYDGLLDDDAKARRLKLGLPAEPELVVLTRQGPSPTEVWAQLRERHPGSVIASEGGPTMLGVELEQGLIDELIICVAPMIVGGEHEKRIVEHPGPLGIGLELVDSAQSEGFTFLRYGVESRPR
jgi:riboflavin biosynthesis pyrimidine reductase